MKLVGMFQCADCCVASVIKVNCNILHQYSHGSARLHVQLHAPAPASSYDCSLHRTLQVRLHVQPRASAWLHHDAVSAHVCLLTCIAPCLYLLVLLVLLSTCIVKLWSRVGGSNDWQDWKHLSQNGNNQENRSACAMRVTGTTSPQPPTTPRQMYQHAEAL